MGAILGTAGFASTAASGNISGKDLQRAQKVRAHQEIAANATGSGYAYCPGKRRVLTGETYWREPGQRPEGDVAGDASLAAAGLYPGGKAWYAGGRTGSAGTRVLSQTVLCVPKRKLRRAKVRSKVVALPYPAWDDPAAAKAKCRRAERVVTGGAFLHPPGADPTPDAMASNLLASYPLKAGKGWHAGVRYSGVSAELELTVTALCLPRDELARIKVRTKRDVVPAYYGPGGVDGLGGKRARCPKGHRALTGGAYWHRAGEPGGAANGEGVFGGTWRDTRRSWFVSGWNVTLVKQRLITVVHCIKR